MLSPFDHLFHHPALQGQFDNGLVTQLDAQISLLATLSQRSHALLARLSELNLQMTRHFVETALDTGRQLAACTEPLQLAPTIIHGWQPLGEHLRVYQQGLMGVVAEAQTGLGHAAAPAPPTLKRPD